MPDGRDYSSQQAHISEKDHAERTRAAEMGRAKQAHLSETGRRAEAASCELAVVCQ